MSRLNQQRPRKAVFRLRGSNVELAIGVIALSIIEARSAEAAGVGANHAASSGHNGLPAQEFQAPAGGLAAIAPDAIHTLSIEQLKALLDADALASLGLGKTFVKLLDADSSAAIRKLESAFRKKLQATAKAQAKLAAAGDHAATHDHDHLRAGSDAHHELGLFGGIPLLLPLLGAAAVAGVVVAATNGGGHGNDAPVANPDSVTTLQETPVTFDVRSNDTDKNGDALSVTQINGTAISTTSSVTVTGGVVSLGADGKLTFTPAFGYSGAPSFSYTVSDGRGGTSTATVSLTVTHVNHAPAATADTFTTPQETAVTINVLANDTDRDGDKLTVTQVNGTAISATQSVAITGGSVILDAAGNIVFTPALNFRGSPSFSYTVSDGNGGTATATVSGTVTPVNHAPVAVNDSFTVAEDNAITIAVRTNDSDRDGDALKVTQVNGTAISTTQSVAITGGSVILNAAGDIVFTPTKDYNGSPSFTYTISDGNGGTATATVSGTVTPVNDAPVNGLTTLTVSASAGVAVAVPGLSVSDVDSANLTTTVSVGHGTLGLGLTTVVRAIDGLTISGLGTGTLTLAGPQAQINAALAQLSFTGATGFSGADTLTITTSDGQLTDTDTLTLTVGQTLTGIIQDGYVAGATVFFDANGNGVYDPGEIIATTDAQGHFALAINGPLVGNIVAFGGINTDTGLPNNTTLSAPAGSTVVNPLTTLITQLTATGLTVAQASAQVSTALGLSSGLDLTHFDFLSSSNDATISLAVQKAAVQIVTLVNQGISAGLSSNAITASIAKAVGTGAAVDLTSTSSLQSILVNAGASASSAATAALQTASINQKIADATSVSDVAKTVVSLTGAGANLPPVTADDSATTAQGKAVTIDVLANDKDPEGGALKVVKVNGVAISVDVPLAVAGGTVTLGANGLLTYTPTAGYSGAPSFTYTAQDSAGNVQDATVRLTVTPVNHAPVAVGDTFTTPFGYATGIDVLANDSDVDGDKLTITQINGTAITAGHAVAITGGSLFLPSSSGPLIFTPTSGYSGSPSFTYTVSDGNGGTATATVSGTVQPDKINHVPVAVADTFATKQGTPVTIDVLANDTDADGDKLTVARVNGAAISTVQSVAVTGGSVILDASGKLVFTPTAGYTGSPSFTYTITDGLSLATATVSGTVTAPNHAPVAVADTFTTTQGAPVAIDVLANDSDADGDKLTVTQVDGKAVAPTLLPVAVTGGTVAPDASGKLVFTPTSGYSGSPSFTYTISDGNGGTATATVSGTVTVPTPVNHAPVAHVDTANTGLGAAVSIDVLANDTDTDGDKLTVTTVNGAAASTTTPVAVTGGSVLLGADGHLVFTPATGFVGQSSFGYGISDGHGGTSSSTVTVTTAPTSPVLAIAPADFPTVLANGTALHGAGVTTLDVSGDLSISQAQAQATIAAGLTFATADHITVATTGTHLSTTLKNLQDLHVDTMLIGGGTAALVAGESLADVAAGGLPHFQTPIGGDANITLDLASGNIATIGDLATIAANLASAGIDHLDVTGGAPITLTYAQGSELAAAHIDFTPASDVTLNLNGVQAAQLANNPSLASELHVDHLHVVDGPIALSDAQAAALVGAGLDFATADDVTVTAAATHLSTTLKGLQDLHVDTVLIAGAAGGVHVTAGEGLGDVAGAALPHFQTAAGGDANVTLDLASGNVAAAGDLTAIASKLAGAGIDHLDTLGGAPITLDYAQGVALNAQHIDFTRASDVTMTVTGAQAAALAADPSLAANLHVHHLDVVGVPVTLTDPQAAALVGAGLDFATGDEVIVSASGTHMSTTLKGLQDLHVDTVLIAGGAALHVTAGEGLGDIAGAGLPHFMGLDGVATDVTLDLANGNISSVGDLATIASQLALAEVDHLDVVGGAPVSLDYVQAQELAAAHVDFTLDSNVTLNVTSAQAAALDPALLTALHVDHLHAVDPAGVTITDLQASALISAGVDFAAADNVTVTVAGTHVATSLRGLQDLHVDTVLIAGGAAMLTAGDFFDKNLAQIASGALPHFVNGVGGDADVTLQLSSGNLVVDGDLTATANKLAAAGIDHLVTVDAIPMELTYAQGVELAAAHIDFKPAQDVVLDVTGVQAQQLAANASLANQLHVDHLHVTDGTLTITDAQASALVAAGLDFAVSDQVNVKGAGGLMGGTHLSTTLKGLQDLHIDNVLAQGFAPSLRVDAGTADLTGLAAHALPHFASALDVTLTIGAGTIATGTDLGSVGAAFEQAGIDHIGVGGNGALSLTVAQAESFAMSGLTFAQASAITITDTAAQIAALADNPFTLVGLNIDRLHAATPVTITDRQAANLVLAKLPFTAADTVTVTAGATMSTTLNDLINLNVDVVQAQAGVSSLHIDAGEIFGIYLSGPILPHFVAADGTSPVDVTLRADISEFSDIVHLANALDLAGVDHIAFNQALTSEQLAELQAADTSGHLTVTQETFSYGEAVKGLASDYAVSAGIANQVGIDAHNAEHNAQVYRDLLTSFETSPDNQSHGGAMQIVDGAASSLAEAGMLRAYTAETLTVDGTTSGDHLLTTLKDIADIGVDQIKLADQGTHPVYVDLGIQNDQNAVTDIQSLFQTLSAEGHGTGTGSIFTGAGHVALVVDVDTANALASVDPGLTKLASLGFTEVDVLKTSATPAPAFGTTPAGFEVKVIGQDDDLYKHLHHGA